MQKIYDIGLVPKREELAERFMFPFSQVNYLLNGGELDRVTLITSGTDNGKSTISSQIICDIIRQGYNACCFFGEDTPYESQDRIYKQSLYGEERDIVYKPYKVNGKETNCGEWVLTEEAYEKARKKFEGRLFLYNTKADASVDEILEGFEQARVQHNCRVFLIDNVEQFSFSSDNENKAIKDIVIKIRDYAINNKVHIFLVSHIRKTERGVILPSMFDIKGTSALINIAKNVLIIVRMDKVDHESQEYKSLRRLLEINNYDLDQADCLVHIAKTKGRKIGFACLKYNKKTNTYYDCKKIDERREETEQVDIIIPKPKVMTLEDYYEGNADELPF